MDRLDQAFPAGDESDASNEEWDMGCTSDKTTPCIKDLEAVAPRGDDTVSVLKRAINEGDTVAVEKLLDDGMDVEARLDFAWTPLMCAVSVGSYEVAKLLLDRGASANFSKDHYTVLMASCTASASEDKIARCVELLLSRNADPNMVDSSQMTCLMLAARDGHSKVINILVSHGADINAQNLNGYTALSVAVQYGRKEAVLKLLQLGADKTIKTKNGRSPADMAHILKHTQIARILSSSSHTYSGGVIRSVDNAHAKLSESASSKECVNKIDELELFLRGLDLDYLVDTMTEHDVTKSYLLTMEKQDLEKIGITDPEDQQKLLSAVQQLHTDTVDLDTFSQVEVADSGSEELQNFLLSVSVQFSYLSDSIQDIISRLPHHPSQLVFSLDPKKEAQAICNKLMVQTKDLEKDVTSLRNLIHQMGEVKDDCQLPRPASHNTWRVRFLPAVVLGMLGASVFLLLCRTTGVKLHMQ
ncbi:ankyrin repeat, SAM and basic leucine zipper domain-containing protein 1 [Parambassis ranga]|uniref:Ankyrin repeat, SAM and basic leucine zipper domain-containing protein 1 n=1 Tax=Parambassis ranga TaxID=210632 RepID=A0A6P7KCC6_9TELE|nr:ankyrin repeat, SAM and basic leucine zipper domain-containing protein 1 [Parambassis ranga]